MIHKRKQRFSEHDDDDDYCDDDNDEEYNEDEEESVKQQRSSTRKKRAKISMSRRRRSLRGVSSLSKLAHSIVQGQNVVIITGAGLSVASGIRPFRSRPGTTLHHRQQQQQSQRKRQRKKLNHHNYHYQHQQQQSQSTPLLGIWNSVLWKKATRKEFRKDPLKWYNEFWLQYFPNEEYYPNDGHFSIATLQQQYPNVKVITQNIDGLHHQASQIVLSNNRKHCLQHQQREKQQEEEQQHEKQQPQLKEEPPPNILKHASFNTMSSSASVGTSSTIVTKCTNISSTPRCVSDSSDDSGITSTTTTGTKTSTSSTNNNNSSDSFQIVEAHGRLGLYKCLPDEDSDTDSSDDEDDHRLVHLGHHRKRNKYNRQLQQKKQQKQSNGSKDDINKSNSNDPSALCKYQMIESLSLDQLGPPDVRNVLKKQKNKQKDGRAQFKEDGNDGGDYHHSNDNELEESKNSSNLLQHIPSCPCCGNSCLPQALLFDEGYHSHDYYQFQKMETWLEEAQTIVFCGTSFAVQLTQVALEHARACQVPVYNFNLVDALQSTAKLNVENILGPSQETLPKLLTEVQKKEELQRQREEFFGKELPILSDDDYDGTYYGEDWGVFGSL